MESAGAPVRVEIELGVARVTMDSQHNRNALSTAMIDGLRDALAGAIADPAVRVIMLTHAGPVFCSGADLKETAAAFAPRPQAPSHGGAQQGRPVPAGRLGELLAEVWESPKPVLARVAGPARAGGLGLIAAADIAVCADEASFAFSEVRIGVVPAVISATVLPRLTPRAAAELYLTGTAFDGTRAAAIGLVTASVPAGDLDAAAGRYVDALLRGAPGALAGVKALLGRASLATMRDELAELTEMSVSYFSSAEGIEGVAAFRDKRDPAWVSQP